MCDEAKKTTQDFRCDKTLLLSSMKYFEKYLSDQQTLDDIDISVHCDISIFDWLMKYVHDMKNKKLLNYVPKILFKSLTF